MEKASPKLIKFRLELFLSCMFVVVTRSNKVVTNPVYDSTISAYPISGDLDGEFRTWTKDGEFYPGSNNHNEPNDLFLVAKD